jgi:predicted aconitase
MEILVAIGEIYGADKLVNIKSAHISGISYQNIGDAGLEWLESLSAEVSVTTTVNPAGMDLLRWKDMGIDEGFYRKQMRIIKALERIGAEISLTCTPYYYQDVKAGEHLAWAESNAVIYANSVLGARTNRESGITAIAAGIIGKTPRYGMHVKENRAPNILVKVRSDNASLIGYELGKMLEYDEIPLIELPRKFSDDELKLMGAAMAATGNKAIFHVINQTPEWSEFEVPKEKIELEILDVPKHNEVDLVALGCPHLSIEELKRIKELLEGKKVKRELWLFTARAIAELNKKLVENIEKSGAKVFCDTCMVVSPATENFECVMVNSGKALEYLPKLRKVRTVFGTLEECIKVAVS